jgi:glutathione synthase/RimK-type ligase-like ATP-grasp enzyme
MAPASTPDLLVLYEHPQWQEPLFAALERRGVGYAAYDLKRAAFGQWDPPPARLALNQASPSAYLRGHTRAVPLALALMESLEASGVRVLNGSRAFRFEISKATQARVVSNAGIDYPRTLAFNDLGALRARAHEIGFPAILKPNQGGSGARMFLVQALEELEDMLARDPHVWEPDHLLLLQEYLPHDRETNGVVRMEFLGGELLYAMRVKVPDGSFNLCPSVVCHPEEGGDGACKIPATAAPSRPPSFEPFPEVPDEAVQVGRRICALGGLDLGGIEYLETPTGRRVFYDINANSNLRASVAQAYGFNPFERVVDYLEAELRKL